MTKATYRKEEFVAYSSGEERVSRWGVVTVGRSVESGN